MTKIGFLDKYVADEILNKHKIIITSSKIIFPPEIFTNLIYVNEDQHGEKCCFSSSKLFIQHFNLCFFLQPYFADRGLKKTSGCKYILFYRELNQLNFDFYIIKCGIIIQSIGHFPLQTGVQ